MQIPIIPFRGQQKPWGSIPRIDALHPLASGLKFYIYDAGGIVMGLRRGGVGLPFPGTNDISTKTSRYGSAVKYPGTTTDTSIVFPLRASPAGLIANPPWSVAMGSMNIAAPVASAIAAGDCDNATSSNIAIGPGATTTTYSVYYNNGGTILTTGAGTNSLSKFHTILTTVPSATTANIYCDGKLDQTSSTGTKTSNVAGTQFVFNSGQLNGGAFCGGSNGFIYYFAGWNRLLSAQEARQLHTDPWCFLIFPEDQVLATMVGSTAQFTWSRTDNSEANIAAYLKKHEMVEYG